MVQCGSCKDDFAIRGRMIGSECDNAVREKGELHLECEAVMGKQVIDGEECPGASLPTTGKQPGQVQGAVTLICTAATVVALFLEWIRLPLLETVMHHLLVILGSLGLQGGSFLEAVSTPEKWGIFDLPGILSSLVSYFPDLGAYVLSLAITGMLFLLLWVVAVALLLFGFIFFLRSQFTNKKVLRTGFIAAILACACGCVAILIANAMVNQVIVDAFNSTGSYDYSFLPQGSYLVPGLGPILACITSVIGIVLLRNPNLLGDRKDGSAIR